MIRALFGEWAYKLHTGDLTTALIVAKEMVALAELENDPIVRIVAVTSLGINYAHGGVLSRPVSYSKNAWRNRASVQQPIWAVRILRTMKSWHAASFLVP